MLGDCVSIIDFSVRSGVGIRLDTLAAVRRFLAFYQSNAGTHDFEHPSFCLRQHILALMGLMSPRYIWPLHQLVEPSADEVADLQPICPEVAPFHLVCGQLPASTLLYLRQFRLGDRRLLGLRPMDVMLPGGPYQAHLRLR